MGVSTAEWREILKEKATKHNIGSELHYGKKTVWLTCLEGRGLYLCLYNDTD
jgi:hypothetical protein